MNPAPSRLFFHDPVTTARCDYEELRSHFARGVVAWAPARRPRDFASACRILAEAVVLGRELTVYDADFSAAEIEALGGGDEIDRTVEVACEAPPDVDSMLARARVAAGFRLGLFTSGSTGLPKKVVHSLAGLTRMLRVGGSHARDVWGFAYNPTHIAGVQVFLQAFFNANPLINLFQIDPAVARAELRRHGITHLSATPSFYRLLLPVEEPMPWVRAITLGGERCEAGLIERLRAAFPQARIHNLYASTEAGTVLAADGECFTIPEPLRDVVRLRGDRLELHASLLGEFSGRGQPAAGDWYETGDVVEIVSAEPLRFRIVSRDRDWLNVGGNKVNPAEVEEVLTAYPGIREARVFGRKNSVLGQLLCAELVAEAPPDEAALRAYVSGRLQAFKVPRVYSYVARLDRTRTGKLRRT